MAKTFGPPTAARRAPAPATPPPTPAPVRTPAETVFVVEPVSTHSLRMIWPDGFSVDLLPVGLKSNAAVHELRDAVVQRLRAEASLRRGR